ncbi:PREDICTED: olfactory receptor 1G1-like [Nanorana parkeri]|uniref:olfactory receptor 1G1-like n=1 Tax=Nanorana parkeri TaxID=125878 RepID=UPI0008546342|nr:PREDICTED: olfactory receptor 1G1-like [Nanorana parkeri]
MESNTSVLEFHILPFFIKADNKLFIFSIGFIFLIYFIGILVNLIIITVICLDLHLHTPMYLFLCNLSIIDICYTTVIIPKLLYILLSGNNIVSFTQCFIQMYFFYLAGTTEDTVLFIMAYDRYVAICHPLHYHRILRKKICILIMMVTWICGYLNSLLFTSSILKMFFCSSSTIPQIFCDGKALINIACRGTEMFYIVLYMECFVFGLCPVMCNLMSYVKIIRVILRIKSKDGRRKAFSTCSSHLIVMAIYYGCGAAVYLTPPSDRYALLEQILTMFYTTVVPMLNPLIYSLRNNEIKNSLWKLLA